MSRAIPLLPSRLLVACYRVTFTFFIMMHGQRNIKFKILSPYARDCAPLGIPKILDALVSWICFRHQEKANVRRYFAVWGKVDQSL
jgi:hypothetical protein